MADSPPVFVDTNEVLVESAQHRLMTTAEHLRRCADGIRRAGGPGRPAAVLVRAADVIDGLRHELAEAVRR